MNHSGQLSTGGRTRIWLALIPAMSLPFLASMLYFVWFSDHRFARIAYGATKLFLVIWPLVALRFLLHEPFRWIDIWPARSGRAMGAGIASGAGIMVLMVAAYERTALGEVVRQSAPGIRAKVDALGVIEWYWAFGLFLAVLHSFIEEYYWRWFLFGRLRGVVPAGLAHIAAGIAFAAHHLVITTQYFPWGWGWVFGGLTGAGGLLWSWMYARQKSLAGAWISHVLVDLGILGVGHHVLFGTWW